MRARAQSKPDRLVYIGDNGPWHACLQQEVAPAFEKQTGIKVDFSFLPGDALTARLKGELSAGSTSIDIIQWNPNMAGWITPHMQDHTKLLAAYAAPDFDWPDFLPSVQAMATYNGKLSGIPYRVITDIMFYQKPVLAAAGFDKPPESFAQFLAAAQACTKQGAPHRYGTGFIARQGPAILDPFTPFLRSAGGDFYNPKTGEIFINKQPGVEALDFYGGLMSKYHVMNPDSLTWEFDGVISGGQNDQFAMCVTIAPYGEPMNDPKLSKTAGNWAFAPVPGRIPSRKAARIRAAGCWACPRERRTRNGPSPSSSSPPPSSGCGGPSIWPIARHVTRCCVILRCWRSIPGRRSWPRR